MPLWLRAVVFAGFAGWTFWTTFLPELMDFSKIPILVMALLSVFGYFRAGAKGEPSLASRRAAAAMWLALLGLLYVSGQYKFSRMQSRMEPVFAALEAYKAENGAYPKSLRSLAPRYIEKIPDCGIADRNFPFYFQSHDERSADGSLGPSQFHLVCSKPVWIGYSRYAYDSQYGYWQSSFNLK